MSLLKAILHGKEFRKPYIGAKSIDKTCRNNGSCSWCSNNRLYQVTKERQRISLSIAEYLGINYYGKRLKRLFNHG